MENRIGRLSINASLDRTATKTDFGMLLARGLTAGASVASAIVPGGAILSAAINQTAGQALSQQAVVRGGSAYGGGGRGIVGTGSSTADGSQSIASTSGDSLAAQREMMIENQKWTAQYLALQNQMQQESREYNTVSNILKVRHESAKTAINNGLQADMRTALELEARCYSLCFATEDRVEGMNAFLEKRKPNFQGR